jgi:hypothetical protein
MVQLGVSTLILHRGLPQILWRYRHAESDDIVEMFENTQA